MTEQEVDQAFDRVGEAVNALPMEDKMRFAERANRSLVFIRPTIPPVGVN